MVFRCHINHQIYILSLRISTESLAVKPYFGAIRIRCNRLLGAMGYNQGDKKCDNQKKLFFPDQDHTDKNHYHTGRNHMNNKFYTAPLIGCDDVVSKKTIEDQVYFTKIYCHINHQQ